VDVSNRLDVFIARGLAAAGDLPSPDNYEMADVGFMEEVIVSAIIYINGSQVLSKDSLPVSKPIVGSFSVVNTINDRVVNVSCGGSDAAFISNLAANTFAVSISAALSFCPALSMRVAVMMTFSIPGKCFAGFACIELRCLGHVCNDIILA
jgi:hypothetical protein